MIHRHVHLSVRERRRLRSAGVLPWLLGLLFSLLPWTAGADPARIQVLLSETGGAYGELVAALEKRLQAQAERPVQLRIRQVPENYAELAELLATRPALAVPVGVRATALVLRAADTTPILSLLVPYDTYLTLLDNVHPTAARDPGLRSAIYLDQPLERQLNLLQLLLPKVLRLGTLAGPNSSQRIAELETLSAQRGLELATEPVGSGDNPVAALTRLLDRSEVLLALPDPGVFNRTSLQAILLTTYRSDVPVLGFSRAYVNAGALAAVHSSAEQIGAQAGEWIADLANAGGWRLGNARYPDYYSISVNGRVAQSLGISVADEDVLLERLQALEQPQP